MYLKSLTLRGFKSFADKTSMLFDPGLTVVVGPNGSGKSNVSDAILWVLGEQSAKMLRGQAMEDVIFSGSSARDPVGVAEVTLVLDNSDHTLPIDFVDVAITRRMYRSGESEYLINGAPSRLMDVQDILHDSGLGKDTHSIISQGKLDSVLSSKPEERRSLIEEAADISKHRRRKERSAKKLASMDDSLAKAKVVSREIARQLKPLERQVDRAREAHELGDQLKELTTILAVDDLRQLQLSYARLSARDREAEAEVELAQYRLDERSAELEKLRSILEQKGLYAGNLDEQRRRLQDILRLMESDMNGLELKGRYMVSKLSEMSSQLSKMRTDRAEALASLERLESDLTETSARAAELDRNVNELSRASSEASRTRRSLDDRIRRLTDERRAAESTHSRETIAMNKLEERVSNADTQDRLFASRLEQLAADISSAEQASADALSRRDTVSASLARAREAVEAATLEVGVSQRTADAARSSETSARDRLSQAQATLAALEAVAADVESASPLVARLSEGEGAALVECRLADLVEADPDIENVVERHLGDDLAALVVEGDDAATKLATLAAASSGTDGTATVLMRSASSHVADGSLPGRSLAACVRVRDERARSLVDALLGDVRLVDTVEEALAAHREAPHCTYLTSDGATVLPDGRLRLGSATSVEYGSLERKRRIRALRDGMQALSDELSRASAERAEAEGGLVAAREEVTRVKGEVARLSAELSSVNSESGRLEGQLSRLVAERGRIERDRATSQDKAGQAREEVEVHRAAANEARAKVEALDETLAGLREELDEAAKASGAAGRALNDARIELSTARERKGNLESRVRDHRRREQSLAEQIAATESESRAFEVLHLRVKPLHDRYDAIYQCARARAKAVREQSMLAETDSDSLKKTIDDARATVSSAQRDLDAAKAAANSVKVDLGRLEEQVKVAVNAIAATGAVLEDALELPEPEDRAATERTVAMLRRKIDAIGPVNEVAMDEYTRLKERADYINSQVADLESASKSLAKITAAIERKMRSRFLVVFDRVNANFSEIFSVLFPGGTAHLELTDPDHLFDTGVEIVAQPRGKRITKMTLMSGGEKSLTALALLFAVYRARTVPFYVFDEVEAALDDANLSKLLDAIDQLKETTQLIVISHQRRTMEQADVLYGVSMHADGVSHVVSQRLDRSTGKVVDA